MKVFTVSSLVPSRTCTDHRTLSTVIHLRYKHVEVCCEKIEPTEMLELQKYR